MQCPYCSNEDTSVLDSRASSDGLSIRRRRECQKCEGRFSTVETMELLNLMVKKRNGTLEAYNRDKAAAGVRRAVEKRNISEECIQQTVASIERDIQKLNRDEVESQEIGELVMKHLKKLDPVAYIRFASVYRAFEDIETFQEEVGKLVPKKKSKA